MRCPNARARRVVVPWSAALAVAAGLQLAGCRGGANEAPPDDDDSATDDDPCGDGMVLDGEDCVPEHCGVGTWGDLTTDDDTVFVDAAAPEGGDGSAGSPVRSVREGVMYAGSGGHVVIAAGTYRDALALLENNAGVTIEGRCAELVSLDATDGHPMGTESAIFVDPGNLTAPITISGITVTKGHFGLYQVSGTLTVRDAVFTDNVGAGVFSMGSTANLLLDGVEVRDNVADEEGAGIGIMALDGADVTVRGCTVARNPITGLGVAGSGTEVVVEDTEIREHLPDASGDMGYGAMVVDGGQVEFVDSTIADARQVGIDAGGAGTLVRLVDSTIRDTAMIQGIGIGAEVFAGARLELDSSLIEGDARVLLYAFDDGTSVRVEGSTFRGAEAITAAPNGAVVVSGGAQITVDDSTFERLHGEALYVWDAGTSATVSRSTVEEIVAPPHGVFAPAMRVSRGGTLTARDTTLTHLSVGAMAAVDDGSTLTVEGCAFQDIAPAFTSFSTGVIYVTGGAAASVQDCRLQDVRGFGAQVGDAGSLLEMTGVEMDGLHLDAHGDGAGVGAWDGATLSMQGCTIRDAELAGLWAGIRGDALDPLPPSITLDDVEISATRSIDDGDLGRGITVDSGTLLVADGLVLADNQEVGLIAAGEGTLVQLENSIVRDTRRSPALSLAAGLVAQDGAHIEATGLQLTGNEGVGIGATHDGVVVCTGCALEGNALAGAAVTGGTLDLADTTITAAATDPGLAGGVGIYTDDDDGPGVLLLDGVDIGEHPLAALWLTGEGRYQVLDSTLGGGAGQQLQSGTMVHGNAVFAGPGVTPWDGDSGLLLSGCTLHDSAGAGVMLHGASATLDGNVYGDNAVDLLQQSCDGMPSPEGLAEVPHVDLCPEYDNVVVPLRLPVYLSEDAIEQR